ncbi:MAG: MBL fold metallo-hydrolase [Clostridia bacterium]|nr:MBL fold metallo-hydrolase [Clostridia bacterium]
MLKTIKYKAIAFILAMIMPIISFGCYSNGLKSRTENLNAPSVNFLSVGQGDCTFIIFPDGKTMLIDCGERSDENIATISAYVDSVGGSIDFLVLSHTDSDHTGCAAEIIRKYGVKRAYIPKINDLSAYTSFAAAISALDECNAEKVVSVAGVRYIAENYFFCFLYPNEYGYDDVNYDDPTANNVNETSSVLYVDYQGVKFVFTGDATKDALMEITEDGLSGLYYAFGTEDFRITLSETDFLKVPHHGGAEEICEDFYDFLNPKNAVISVGANNNYGHPSVYTLIALNETVGDLNILRTDVLGSISVVINDGEYKIITDAD